ncbi:jg22257 [Pararge aegeria aegeria]|uniref:Jg22257 protein n=1 Tax=Pararge aegeria aegeria TaxID=348720 RepID=A0A8S4QPX1_9NEOP|nr:jg22257 [Pararge aegeria aegeria]
MRRNGSSKGWNGSVCFALVSCASQTRARPVFKFCSFRIWNVTEDSDLEKYQYYYEFVELIGEISFRGNLQNFWKYQNDESVNHIDLLQLAIRVHPNLPLKVTTSQNKEVQWIPVMTEEGLCQSFNSEYAQYQRVNDQVWKTQELMMCHYHSEACFVRIDSEENGIRVWYHLLYSKTCLLCVLS